MHNVMVLGSGARQKAVARKLIQSPNVSKVFHVSKTYSDPHPKITQLNIELGGYIEPEDHIKLYNACIERDIAYIVTANGDMLAAGIVDFFNEKGIDIFGPSKQAAQLESSKEFGKQFMIRHGIPTAEYRVFTSFDDAVTYVASRDDGKLVIKYDGLVQGRGVTVCSTNEEAKDTLRDLYSYLKKQDKEFRVIVEEFISGPEASLHLLFDGNTYKVFPLAQDHKPRDEGNKGPNTGGMGTYAPLPWVNEEMMDIIEERIIKPTIDGMKKDGIVYTGALFPGIMFTERGPYVLEYNTRFGAPETQTYMTLLDSDLDDLFRATIGGFLDKVDIKWRDGYAATVEICSQNYPKDEEISEPIALPDVIDDGVAIYHGNTILIDGVLHAVGGKLLSVSGFATNFDDVIEKTQNVAGAVKLRGKHYRRDIGRLDNTMPGLRV